MQVILKEDVQKLGRAGQTVKIADGYGRNYLLPKKLAVIATPANLKRLEQELNSKTGQAKRQQLDARYLADSIQAQPVVIKMASGEAGKLFGSVTSADIEKALSKRNITVDKRKIELDEPIKILGQHTVTIKLHSEVTAELMVIVESESAAAGTASSAQAQNETTVKPDEMDAREGKNAAAGSDEASVENQPAE